MPPPTPGPTAHSSDVAEISAACSCALSCRYFRSHRTRVLRFRGCQLALVLAQLLLEARRGRGLVPAPRFLRGREFAREGAGVGDGGLELLLALVGLALPGRDLSSLKFLDARLQCLLRRLPLRLLVRHARLHFRASSLACFLQLCLHRVR